MHKKPIRVAIINRSFWPVYPVIGEALLRFAERAPKREYSLSVIIQDKADIKSKLRENKRGKGVFFYPARSLSTSKSRILVRILDLLFFMSWVIVTLLWIRPKRVYVSTDPPVIVPFIVMIYCQLFRAKYIYHLQDIHPEATNVVLSVNKWIYKLLLNMDVMTMQKANQLVTINSHMASVIKSRSGSKAPINILPNPAVSFDDIDTSKPKILGFSFCGNAGRLQRIPFILDTIETYYKRGGCLEFTFAGGGLYSHHLKKFAKKFPNFYYHGKVSANEAAQISADYTWALLPIEDEVTRFAFPSKSSSYVFSGANILGICGAETSVAHWVNENRIGIVVKPDLESVVNIFFDIENGAFGNIIDEDYRDALKKDLSFDVFIERLNKLVLA